MSDTMQLVEYLIKAGFCFLVWQDKLLYWLDLENFYLFASDPPVNLHWVELPQGVLLDTGYL